MDILIDTQILIWSFDVNSPLSLSHKELLEDSANRIFVSQVSLMELAIKKNINKLPAFLPSIEDIIKQTFQNGFEILTLNNSQIASLVNLPLMAEHRDPFDRLLIAIAKHESFYIMTTDTKFNLYSPLVNIV